jgi:hypothetical protein
MPQKTIAEEEYVIDAGRVESPNDPVDDEVSQEFREAGHLGQGSHLSRKLREYTDKQPDLSGGDLDAAWDQADVGDETVGGDNPTPGQDVVDALGAAAGITYEDSEPLHATEKIEERDRKRWELDPASAEDFAERKGSTHKPLKKRKF